MCRRGSYVNVSMPLLYVCRRGSSILMNDEAGYLLRSKPEYENEGGVGTAVTAVDSPLLVSKQVYLQNIISYYYYC